MPLRLSHFATRAFPLAATLIGIPSPAFAGPDLMISDIPSVAHLGPVAGVHGYALGYSLCNIGDSPAAYIANTNQHPIVGFALYRISGGRIDQIGISWMKHGFCALQQSGMCGTCQAHTSCAALGVGCYDTSSPLGGAPASSGAGPRFEVNPVTGDFRYPFSNPGGTTGSSIFKLCQVRESDLQDSSAVYAFEGQVVHPQDNGAGMSPNNFSHRRAVLQPNFAFTPAGATARGVSAIHAWREHGLGPNQPDQSVLISRIDVPDDGRFWIASKVVGLGPGLWRYTYTVQNETSDRAASAFIIPFQSSFGSARDASFHDVNYHSGEPFDLTDWRSEFGRLGVEWTNDATYQHNPNANALRWGSAYTFRFDSASRPRIGSGVLRLFKPAASLFSAAVHSPASDCLSDFDDGSGLGMPDGGVTIEDLLYYLAMFDTGDLRADVSDGSGLPNPDGGVTIDDLLFLLGRFGSGC